MFTRRRPVPSPRTVRFLYQFGYICSGTAFGLATLCLEEQRRRIQILQRIADNAKIIRQHPRYKGNATLAFANGGDLDSGVLEAGWTPERLIRRGRRRQAQNGETNEDAVESPTLPSVVEREYADVVDEDENRSSRFMTPHRSQTSSLNRHGRSDHQVVLDARLLAQKQPVDTISLTNARQDEALQEIGSSTLRYQPPQSFRLATKNLFDDERDSLHASNAPRDTESVSVLGLDDTTAEALRLKIPPEDLSHDVKLFLDTVDINPTDDAQETGLVSNKLFRFAVATGTSDQIRSLYQWKVSNGSFTKMDASFLCDAFSKLEGRLDKPHLCDFSVSLIESNEFMMLGSTVRLELALKLLGGVSKGNVEAGPSRLRHSILENFLNDVADDDVSEALEKVCQEFISSDLVSIAANLFLCVVESRTHPLLYSTLADKLFDATIKSSDLPDCAALLRWKAARSKTQALEPMINSFVEACGREEMYGLLVDLFSKQKLFFRMDLQKALSSSNKAILAVATGTDPILQPHFDVLYRDLDKSMRSNVDNTSISTLKTIWEATRNFEEIDARIVELATRLKERGDEIALLKLDEAVAEIYVSAGEMDRAFATIAHMHKTIGVSNVAICQTALMFAKRGSWDSLAHLLDVMKKMKNFSFDEGTLRVFNAVIWVHGLHHTADEIWDFVATAIKDLQFTPTYATSDIVLQSFVRKTRLDLIPKWIEFLTASGHYVKMDAQMASDLLREYYKHHRRSHTFIMRLCRILLLHSPSLASKSLIYLVEQAIGYDIRRLSGQRAPWQLTNAEKRLERVKISTHFVPSPGFVGDRQVYFNTSLKGSWFTEQSLKFKRMAQSAQKRDQMEKNKAGSVESQKDSLHIETAFQSLRCPAESDDLPSYHSENVHDFSVSSAWESDEAEHNIEEFEESQKDSLHTETAFDSLRSPTEGDDLSSYHSENFPSFSKKGRKKLEKEMWLQMSIREYSKVLELYHANLDAVGIPASPVILEIAVEACLRLHNGDRTEADAIISRAQEAGMNTTCAIGPLIIHQLKRFNPRNRTDVANLRKTVMEYYRSNDQNGWRTMHYLGHAAAHTLIRHGYNVQGLGLLSSIYTSKWAKDRPLDIGAMTIFLRGYIAMQSLNGIRWVVQTVLEQNILITPKFRSRLRFLVAGNFMWMDRHPREVHPLLESWVELCRERHLKQVSESRKLGRDLVEQILRSSTRTSSVDMNATLRLLDRLLEGDYIAADRLKDAEFVDESRYPNKSIGGSEEYDGLAETRKFLVDDWNAEQEFIRQLVSVKSPEMRKRREHLWMQQETDSEESDGKGVFEGEFHAPAADDAEGKETPFKPFGGG